MTALLEVRDLEVAYGHIEAVQGISFQVDAGEIRTLVGANGAGKSTTLLALSGLVRPRAGSIRFAGEELTRLKTHQIVERGLVQVAEGRAILTTLTVRENLELGAFERSARSRRTHSLERVFELFPILKERAKQLAGSMSGGEQQMVAIGRALMSRPRLLMMDEPSLGLSPVMVTHMFTTIRRLHAEGLTILLVEQNLSRALEIANRGYVVETGKISLAGTNTELLANPAVRTAYLGI